MGYIFKEKIAYKEYVDFIKNCDYLSFMQENLWAKTKEYKNYLVVGVYDDNKLCATAQIIINKKKSGNQFYIPNGFLLDFSNKPLVTFFTENIKGLAKKYHAYVIDVYPNISTKNTNFNIIHNNLTDNAYRWFNEYIDATNNVLFPLYKGKKKVTKTELKKKYEKRDFYLRRGVSFEVSDSLEDIRRLSEIIDDEYFSDDLVGNLMMNFKERVKIIIAKINLPFYYAYLNDEGAPKADLAKIDELIDVIGDEMDIGCALIILPFNTKNNICEYIYNTIKPLFKDLEVEDGLLYQAMIEAQKFGCNFIKISNINLNTDYYVDHFQCFPIKYIGHYSLVINKFQYFLNKEVKRKKENSN